MIFSTTIFFSDELHAKILSKIGFNPNKGSTFIVNRVAPLYAALSLFLFVQFILPLRCLAYPGSVLWHEQGYRFSWRVMLIEKMGYTNFKIVNAETNNYFYVDNQDFLTPLQEKQMSFQPDFILEYAHYLGDHFKKQGHKNIQVFAESYVALNGRLSQLFIDKSIDLYKEKESWKHKNWILPLNDEIKGL